MQSSLGDRMKGYEYVTRTHLMKRTPVIIRLDGKAFHTYTKGCSKPYDEDLHEVRTKTLEYLCDNIQGVIIGYSQSDELSLVLKDWQTYTTQAWFNNNIQKIVSISASMCTMTWNGIVSDQDLYSATDTEGTTKSFPFSNNAMFDSRVFNVPREEVCNYLIWRQQDWERNSVQMLAQSLYSQKELHGLSCPQLVTKVEEEYGIVWGMCKPWAKQGEIWIKDQGILTEGLIFKDSRAMVDALLNQQEE